MDFNSIFLQYAIFVFVNFGLSGLIVYYGSPRLAGLSIRTRVPVIFYIIILFLIAWPIGSYCYKTFSYLSGTYNYYSFYHRFYEYWAYGVPLTFGVGFSAMYKRAEVMVDDYLKEQEEKKRIKEALKDKGWANNDEIKRTLK